MSNVCQNGLTPSATVKSEPGLNVPLPAVPLPESVARNLNHAPPAAPVAVTTSGGAVVGPAPAPKPLYRPFALSPPPPSSTTSAATAPTSSATVTPSSLPAPVVGGALPQHHPAYRPGGGVHPHSQQPQVHNPFFPYYPPPAAATGGGASSATSTSALNGGGLYVPPQTTTPPSNTNTVASSHQDLTCKSHLPKLAHALTTTTSSRPLGTSLPASGLSSLPNKSNYPSLPLNDPANLRRELDQRYLATGSHENRTLAGTLGPHPPPQPPLFGSNPLVSPAGLGPLGGGGLPPSSQHSSPNSFLASSLVSVLFDWENASRCIDDVEDDLLLTKCFYFAFADQGHCSCQCCCSQNGWTKLVICRPRHSSGISWNLSFGSHTSGSRSFEEIFKQLYIIVIPFASATFCIVLVLKQPRSQGK